MSTGNECVVSNGATLAVLGTAPTQIEGHSTRMTITGAGTLWTNLGELNFGQYSNVLCITGGATLVDDHATIENGMSYPNFSPNMEIVAGTNSLWNNHGNFYMTDTGGQLFVTNGGTLSDDYGYFGDAYSSSPDSNCIATVSGPGSLWTNQADFYIGYDGSSNQVIVNDSGKLNAQTAYVGYNGNGNQLVVSDSGVITVRGLNIGTAVNSKSNSVVLSGGTITVTTFSTSLIQYGTLTINSGLFTAVLTGTDVSGPIGSKIMLHGGTFQSAGTSYRNPAPFAVGDGTDAATYEMLFTTSQNGGTHSFSGGLSVSSNGLVKGFGTIAANVSVNNGGVIAPGATNLGTIVVKGNATLNPGSTTVMKLDASSGASDSLTGATNLVYGGTLQLTNISAALTAGKSFKLFGATNYFGAFSNLNPTAPGAGLRWDTNELNVDGTLRVFSSTTPAPTLGNIVMANGNLTVSAIGGIPFDPCYLLTSTNLTDWSYTTTNYFDASGAASFTNAVAPAEPQQYFRVQVN
jgi:T5SS/PEP-CTERM-associated repeat protein